MIPYLPIARATAVALLLAAPALAPRAQDSPRAGDVTRAEGAPRAGVDALFEYDGRRYAAEDLSVRMQQLYGTVLAEHHQALRTLVDEMLFDLHVEREARRTGRDVQELGREMLAVPEPTITELRGFYENNRAAIGQPFELVADQIRRHLERQALLERRQRILNRLKAAGGFRLLIPAPQPPPIAIDTRGRPLRGDPSAPVTLVEFADFQCPDCRRAQAVMDRLFERHPDAIKLVHMDFPVNPSGISRRVAMGGVCAQQQGRFWRYKALAYERQPQLGEDSPAALAAALGLDLGRFEACMQDPATRARLDASAREGRRLGITATPTLFVDGRPFPSNHLLRDLGEYIRDKTGAGEGS